MTPRKRMKNIKSTAAQQRCFSQTRAFRKSQHSFNEEYFAPKMCRLSTAWYYPKEFLEAYNLGKSSGSLQTLQEFFKDSNITDQTLYINGRGDKIYYSKGDESTGIDLYTMDKLLDRFGNEKKLPASINEEGNQAYPFVMNDGLTIYFASTGHGSLGGYDLFVTRYNLSSDSYLTLTN